MRITNENCYVFADWFTKGVYVSIRAREGVLRGLLFRIRRLGFLIVTVTGVLVTPWDELLGFILEAVMNSGVLRTEPSTASLAVKPDREGFSSKILTFGDFQVKF